MPSTSKLPTEHNKAFHLQRDGEREEKALLWILALPASPNRLLLLFKSVLQGLETQIKLHYKLCEALGVESFSYRFVESGNQEFILAVYESLKVILQHKSNTLELRKIPLARILHDLGMA